MPLQDVGIRYEIEIEGDDDAITRATEIDEAYQSITPTVDVSIAADVDDTEIVPFDEMLTDIEGEHTGTASVTTESDEATQATFGWFDALKAGIAFAAIINVAGTILDALRAIENLTLTPFLDVDEASAAFEAHTGIARDNISDMIFQIHQADLGDFTDIERVLETAQQIGAPLEEGATAALTFTKVFSDQDPTDVLRRMNQLIELGLVDNFGQAADLLTVGFQEGANRSGDFLSTLERYAPTFAAMGLTGEEAIALLNSGLRAGLRNTQDFGRQIDTLQRSIITAVSDSESELAGIFDDLGVELPAVGERIGADFIQNVIDSIEEIPPGSQRDAITTALFGGKAEEALLTIDVGANLEPVEGGEAAEAASAIDDHLRGVFDDIGLELETMAQEFLSSDQMDLPGKLEALKNGLQVALQEVAAGASLGEALEKGLQIEGLADFIGRFESGIGNLAIVILQFLAGAAETLGRADVAESLRAEATRLSVPQLAFDLKLADNGEAVTSAVTTALQRGVSQAQIEEALSTAVSEQIASGDILGAQTLVDNLSHAGDEAGAALVTNFLSTIRGTDVEAEVISAMGISNIEEVTAGQIIETQGAISDAIERVRGTGEANFFRNIVGQFIGGAATETIDTAPLEAQITTAIDELGLRLNEAVASGDFELAAQLAEQLDMEETALMFREMALEAETSMGAVGTSAEEASGRVGRAVWQGSIVPDFMKVTAAANTYIRPLGGLIIEFGNLAEQGFAHASYWAQAVAESFMSLGNALPILQGINAELIAMAALGTQARNVVQAIPPPGGGGGNTTNVTLNQTNNINNPATGANVTNQTANAVRGY